MKTTRTLYIIKFLKPKIGERAASELVKYIEESQQDTFATKTDLRVLEIALRKELHTQTWKILGGIAVLLGVFSTLIRFLPP